VSDVQDTGGLICVECGRRAAGAETRGWRAHVADVDEVACYCPACACREFGDGDDD